MTSLHRSRHALLAGFSFISLLATGARADESADVHELRAEIKLLEQKLDALEKREAARDEAAAAAPAPSATVVVAAPAAPQSAPAPAAWGNSRVNIDDTGFSFASANGQTFINLHGLVQADSRWFFDSHGIANNDTFVIRRARLIYEGAFDKIFTYQIVPEFGGGATGTSNAPVIYDANLGISLTPGIKIVAGKFKSLIGLELLQNDAALLFDERSLATNLVPSRDVGLQATGTVLGGTLNYSAGVLNGSADAAYTNNTDVDNDKDAVARIFYSPFVGSSDSGLRNLSLGVAGSDGLQDKTGSLTSGYKTDGQQTFFTYKTGVLPQGRDWRFSPQANYYTGPFSAQAEYVVSAVTAAVGSSKAEIANRGWQGAVGYVLTGEKASYNGYTPRHNFNLEEGTWGAWEVGARVSDLKIDSDAFPVFADPNASARRATSYGLAVNWFLSRAIRVSFDVVQTNFQRAPGATGTTNLLIGQDEKAFLTRFQVGF
jgi:phosphate-selective porin OprO/OprP